MINTATAAIERMGEARLGTEERPAGECQDSRANYGWNEVAGYSVSQPLHRRTAALGFADEFHNLREKRFIANAFGAHHETSAGVQRAARDFVACRFFRRHRFAGDHRFIDGG